MSPNCELSKRMQHFKTWKSTSQRTFRKCYCGDHPLCCNWSLTVSMVSHKQVPSLPQVDVHAWYSLSTWYHNRLSAKGIKAADILLWRGLLPYKHRWARNHCGGSTSSLTQPNCLWNQWRNVCSLVTIVIKVQHTSKMCAVQKLPQNPLQFYLVHIQCFN